GIDDGLRIASGLADASGSWILAEHDAQNVKCIDIGLAAFHCKMSCGADEVVRLLAEQTIDIYGPSLTTGTLTLQVAREEFVEGVAVGTGGAEECGHYVLLVICTWKVHQKLSVSNSSNAP